jgi:hypothetical protein
MACVFKLVESTYKWGFEPQHFFFGWVALGSLRMVGRNHSDTPDFSLIGGRTEVFPRYVPVGSEESGKKLALALMSKA